MSFGKESLLAPIVSLRRRLLLAALLAAPCAAFSQAVIPPPDPLVPHDQQLREALQKLTTTGRMMYVVAHPDDEDGPLLTLEARGKGRDVMLYTFTRGEGGQDATGAIFGDELGLLRTLELLQADKNYGVEQRFSRAADFGFSKTPEETLAKWGGKDVPLGDLVRQIRLFKPDVIVAGFSGTPRDGHGHHQASSILAQEAFTAAADPKRFPDDGAPWQAKKLYIGNIPDDQVTLTIDTGAVNPVLGKSPVDIALQGLRHQASQGLGGIKTSFRGGTSRLKLVATAPGVKRVEHETDLFDGLDVSRPTPSARFVQIFVVDARADRRMIAAGDEVNVTLSITNNATQTAWIESCSAYQLRVLITTKRNCGLPESIKPHETAHARFRIRTQDLILRSPVYRDNPLTDTVYRLITPNALDGAIPASSLSVQIRHKYSGEQQTADKGFDIEDASGSGVFVVPPVTLETAPASILRTINDTDEAQIAITAENQSATQLSAEGSLSAPAGWAVTPKQNLLKLTPNATDSAQTLVLPTAQHGDATYTLPAKAVANGATYTEGVHLISRPDLVSFPFYFPAKTQVSFVRADVPADLKVGYIMGAGDDIPDALKSLGVNVTLLTPDDLAHGDLSRFSTIVTGIRAYASRKDLRDNNARLLEYVRNGGTLLVQYEQDWRGFNAGHYTPYPLELGNIRADQEELPVTLLHPDDTLFHAPNTVTDADFRGWIQEYGLYFADKWSPEYEPLLSMHDAGEPAHDGALLRAHYGKGTWMYSGLAMFRQVPNGIPGATRLFLNMISAGHTQQEQPVVNAKR